MKTQFKAPDSRPTTPDCPLCANTRFLHFPDFRAIEGRNIWVDIVEGKVTLPITNAACHVCYPDGKPMEDGRIRSFRDCVHNWNRGEEYLNLIILTARYDMLVKHGHCNVDAFIELYDLPVLCGEYTDGWIERFIPNSQTSLDVVKLIRKMKVKTEIQSGADWL